MSFLPEFSISFEYLLIIRLFLNERNLEKNLGRLNLNKTQAKSYNDLISESHLGFTFDCSAYASQIRMLNFFKTPFLKKEFIASLCKRILGDLSCKGIQAGADDLFPILSLIISKSSLPFAVSNVKYSYGLIVVLLRNSVKKLKVK